MHGVRSVAICKALLEGCLAVNTLEQRSSFCDLTGCSFFIKGLYKENHLPKGL